MFPDAIVIDLLSLVRLKFCHSIGRGLGEKDVRLHTAALELGVRSDLSFCEL